MKKVISIVTLLMLWQSSVIAQTAIAPEDGDGTETNPYQIATWQNLYWLSENSTMWSKHYIQTANIDLGSATPAISTWDSNQGLKTIGNSGTKFTGSYNGQEFTISGLYINRSSSYLGLFGYTEGATLTNLGLISVTVQGDGIQFAGGLAGYTTLSSVVKNCHSSGTITITNNDNKKGFGGLIGWASLSLIEDCYSECDVNAGEATGGFVGNVSNWTTINNCYCSGNVTGNFKTGGFVGINFSSNCKIIQCYCEGNVIGGQYTAGFAGQNVGLIKESYCTGSVTEAPSEKAGFVSWNDTPGQITDCYSRCTVGQPSNPYGNASGFVYSNKGTITDSYNTGQLTGTNRYGFANKNTGTITDCFWDSETTLSNNNGAGGTPKTTAEMKTKSTFTGAGWNFNSIWNILVGINDDYPGFQWNPALMRLVIVTSGASQMIKLPLKGTVNCTVDWGDGTAPENFTTAGDKPHTYSVADTFQVTIYGSLTWFGTSGSAWTGVKYLKEVLSFGELGLTSLMGAFKDADSLKSVPALLPASITNLAATFGNIYPDTIANLSLWDVSNVTTMLSMFDFATNFNQDIGNWDVGNVTNMKSMFGRAYDFNQDIGGWDVAKVTDMSGMFSQAYAFNQDIGGWDVSQVTTLGLMYFQASNFNQNIGNWNVGIVTDFYAMFAGALLFNQDIGDWDVAGATDMGNMFTGASAFNQDVSGWAIEGVTNMDNMFNAATAFNQNLGSWTLNSGVTLTDFLKNCGMDCENYSLTLSGWADNTNTPSGRSMGATGRTYGTDAVTARTTLFTAKGWVITGDIAGTVACMCTNPDDGGTIAEAQTICYGTTPDSLTSTALPTGHTGNLEYKWQSSTQNETTGFADIAGADGLGYQPVAISDTTWFKRLARVDCEADWTGAAVSNVVKVSTEFEAIPGTLAKTPDVTFVCEGDNVSATLTAGSGGNGTDELEYRTYSGTSWSMWTAYTSGTNISTTGKTEIEVRTWRTATYCDNSDTTTVSWTTSPQPVANAGVNATITEFDTYTLSTASAEHYTSVSWTTAGDGAFSNINGLNPVYTPGNCDLTGCGTVELCLTAEPETHCLVADENCMTLRICRCPSVVIVSPAQKEVLYGNPVTITGTASDPDDNLSIIEVRLNGGSWQTATGTTSWTINLDLVPGKNTVEARATDLTSLQSGIEKVEVTFSVQVINIPQGWSYISSYLNPTNPDIVNMWADIVGANNLMILTGINGIYAPAPFYINTLETWDVVKGYKVKMNAADDLIVSGDSLTDKSVTFPAGVHLIPVLTNQTTGLDMVFENPETDILYMLDIYSNQVYWPGGGLYTLNDLVPGKGYLANFKNPVTLTYPPLSNFTVDNATALPPAPGPWPIIRTSNYHLVSVSAEAISQLPYADFIGAFDASGKCAGYAELEKTGQNLLLTIYGDEPITPENDGLTEGELLHFRSFNINENSEKELTPAFNPAFPNVDGLFYINGLSGISGFKESATGIGENQLTSSIRVYPNPAKDVVNIVLPGNQNLTLHETSGLSGFEHETSENLTTPGAWSGLKGTLITAEGKLVKTFIITSPNTQLDVSGLQPGIYLLKIASSQNIVIKRVVIQ